MSEVRFSSSYSGYPQVLPTYVGQPMSVIINALAPTAFTHLWGMSVLERNVRLVERLGAEQIHVLVQKRDSERASRRHFPATCTAEMHGVKGELMPLLRSLVEGASGPVLLLEGHVVYDRRLVGGLWQCPAPAVLRAAADAPVPLLVDADSVGLLQGDWADGPAHFCISERVYALDPQQVQGHISLLRKTVAPRNVRVLDSASHADADAYLKDMAGKGVNDLLAEFVHPPIEFLLTRLVAYTPITPNQVSYFNALLSLAAIPLMASGQLWAGIFCNLFRGVSDGVDGKLARLTLRESQGGDQIDHVVDRVYLPVFFLALGWHLGAGVLDAPAMLVAYGLLGVYGLNRLLATWFAHFVGASSGEFRPIDRLVRRIWPKRNICVLLLLIAMIFGAPLYGFYAMAGLSALMVIYRGVRLDQEGRRIRRERRC